MVRQGTLLFLVRALASTRDQPTKNDLEAIAKAQVSQLGDSQGDVRAAAMEGLGHLMKIFGERAMNPYLEGVSEIQQGKIKESFEKAEVKCKGGAAKPTKPTSAKPATLQPSSTAINRANANFDSTSKPLARKPVLSSMRGTTEPPGSPAIRSVEKVANSPQIKTASRSAFDTGGLSDDAPKSVPRPVARAPPIVSVCYELVARYKTEFFLATDETRSSTFEAARQCETCIETSWRSSTSSPGFWRTGQIQVCTGRRGSTGSGSYPGRHPKWPGRWSMERTTGSSRKTGDVGGRR